MKTSKSFNAKIVIRDEQNNIVESLNMILNKRNLSVSQGKQKFRNDATARAKNKHGIKAPKITVLNFKESFYI